MVNQKTKMDFYVTLPSNTPDVSSINQTNQFRVTLPNTVELSGQWEVGLVEILYPHSWPNLMGNPMPEVPESFNEWLLIANTRFTDKNPNMVYFRYIPFGEAMEIAIIPPGNYDNANELTQAIQKGLEQQNDIIKAREKLKLQLKNRPARGLGSRWGAMLGKNAILQTTDLKNVEQKQNEKPIPQLPSVIEEEEHVPTLSENDEESIKKLPNVHESIQFSYDQILKWIVVTIDKNVIEGIGFSNQLQYMLGLDEGVTSGPLVRYLTHTKTTAKYPVDLRTGFYAMFVYCDIVESQILGNVQVPLLRIVPTEGKYGDIINTTFQNPHYVPVLKKQFSTVEISIKDDRNRLVPFDFGKCILKLHFRKKRPIPL